MGGDHGPGVVVPAAALALKQRPHLKFRFFGDSAKIAPFLTPDLQAVSEVVHTDEVIAAHEKPSSALRRGKNSSMRLAIDDVDAGRADCVVSAGNTGALMATAKLVLRMLPGIDRPAIATILPNMHGGTVTLDLGANLEVDAGNLVQFAILGACFARTAMGIEHPCVGILNIGSEDTKGHEYLQDAAEMLAASSAFSGRYVGFVEGNDITAGTVDVVVTDGFTGNVALKTAEGVGKFIAKVLREEFSRTPFSKLAGLIALGAMRRAKKRMDPRTYNGAMFLGLSQVCIKSHGSADAFAFSRAILVGAGMVENRFNAMVAEQVQAVAHASVHVPVPAPDHTPVGSGEAA
ncbi:MAG: phosphate acyltransferase PlsX [Rhodospirillales bacterium]|nr:phosphate acyltransferase PlsX [Alphaproteobacteria bacterium]MCB9987179.1 phosphate acyltransferase PlsX [Rhodospirillales bacterium]USO08549.1 MAG: phosphate acyltransferase PlsX [Rhodospirillales bacterium]